MNGDLPISDLSRRNVLRRFAKFVGGTVVVCAAGSTLVDVGYRHLLDDERPSRDELGRLVRELFGIQSEKSSVFTGDVHAIASPGDANTSAAARGIILASSPDSIRVEDPRMFTLDNKMNTGILCGSPTSNSLARLFLGYTTSDSEGYDEKRDGLVKDEAMHEALKFPYQFELSRDWLKKYTHQPEGIRKYFDEGSAAQNMTVLNSSISLNNGERIYVPYYEDKDLVADYLLITSILNPFNKIGRITNIGGTHGPSTKAFEQLVRNPVAIMLLSNRVGGAVCWQAIFKFVRSNNGDNLNDPFVWDRNFGDDGLEIKTFSPDYSLYEKIALKRWRERTQLHEAST